jgi:hypothetical protein
VSPVPKRLLEALDARDGHVCAWTGVDTGRLVPQHRQGGMGGRKGKHRLSNLVWLDSLLNGLIESDPTYQAEAIRLGIKISGFADPAAEPVEHVVHGRVVLDDDGGFRSVPSGEG